MKVALWRIDSFGHLARISVFKKDCLIIQSMVKSDSTEHGRRHNVSKRLGLTD